MRSRSDEWVTDIGPAGCGKDFSLVFFFLIRWRFIVQF